MQHFRQSKLSEQEIFDNARIYLFHASWFYSARFLTFDTTYWDETKTRKIRENIFFVLTVFNQNINCKQILMTWMFYWISSINYIQWPFIPCTCVNRWIYVKSSRNSGFLGVYDIKCQARVYILKTTSKVFKFLISWTYGVSQEGF